MALERVPVRVREQALELTRRQRAAEASCCEEMEPRLSRHLLLQSWMATRSALGQAQAMLQRSL